MRCCGNTLYINMPFHVLILKQSILLLRKEVGHNTAALSHIPDNLFVLMIMMMTMVVSGSTRRRQCLVTRTLAYEHNT